MGDAPSSRAAEASRWPRGRRWLGLLAAVAASCLVAGTLGPRLPLAGAEAPAVFPATGIALALFLLLGSRAWPAILAGAWLIGGGTAGSPLAALGIAAGTSLAGLLGSWLVRRFAGGPRVFDRARHVFVFAALAAPGSCAVSAGFGVASLRLAGVLDARAWPLAWLTWWLAEGGACVVVTPLLLSWVTRPRAGFEGWKALEGALLLGGLLGVGLAIFGGWLPWARSLSFLALPVLVWAALRFDRREAATATALLSAMAALGASRGVGPFAHATATTSLLLVQAFVGVSGVTTLAVAAMVLQRRRAEDALSRAAAIVDSSDDAIVGKTLDGTIVSWNRGAERLYGYPAREVLGRNVGLLVPPERPLEVASLIERIRRGERLEPLETVRVRRDGRRVAVSLTLSPIRDAGGEIVGAAAVARDITYRKRAEERLGGQFAVTRALAESSSLGEAAPKVLQAICEGFGWELGELWRGGGPAPVLEAAWLEGGGPAPGPTGGAAALVARVRDSGVHAWVEDLAQDAGLASSAAAAAGLRGALAWPVTLGTEVAAVLALYSRERRAPRQELLDQMDDIGARVAQSLERERALEGLKRLQTAVETIELGVTITDVSGHILYTNPAEAAMHGHRPDELIGKHVSVFMPEGWRPARGRPSQLRSWKRETVNVRRDGSIFPVQLLSDAVKDAAGNPVALVTCTEEITERKRAEDALRSSEQRYRLLFERNLAGVYRATLDGRLLDCNDALAHILGYESREELLRLSLWELSHSPQERAAALDRLRQRGALSNLELRLRRKDGGGAWVLENQNLLADDGGEALVEATLIDITERKEFEQRIEHQAFHDPLTGLPNRSFLEQRLGVLAAEARWNRRGLAVMYVDLDGFKAVNDALGHAVGDRVLGAAAGRLKECVREGDLVARVGGDEFVLLLPQVQEAGAARIAGQILARMREPFVMDGHGLRVTASLGIALVPRDGFEAAGLLGSADAAMYRAKQEGRDAFRFGDQGAAG